MATNGVVAGGMAQHALLRLERIVGNFRQVPVRVWRYLCLAVLILWLCYSFSQLFWLLMPAPGLPEPSLDIPDNVAFAEQNADPAASTVDIEALQELSLFGEGAVDEQPVVAQAPAIEQEAVDTSLRLVLHGAVPSSDPRQAKAIIGDGGKQAGFKPGEELSIGPRGVTLAKVMADRVIIDNNGRYETLWLYENQEGGASGAGRDQANARVSPSAQSPDQAADGEDSESGAREFVGAIMPQGDQQAPTEEQIRRVTDVMNVSMYREGGQLIGFRIRPKGNSELFEELGFEPNDIVTAVNNVGLDDTSRAMEVYRSLGKESRATLEILRDGSTITVDVALDQ